MPKAHRPSLVESIVAAEFSKPIISGHQREHPMKDLLRKSILTGIGLISLSRSHGEEMVKKWVEKGKLSEKEGRELVDQLLKEAQEHKSELKESVETVLDEAIDRFTLARQSQVDELQQQVDELKAMVEELKGEQA